MKALIKVTLTISLILAIGGVTYSLMQADPATTQATARYYKDRTLAGADVLKAQAAVVAANAAAIAAQHKYDSLASNKDRIVARYVREIHQDAGGYVAPITMKDRITGAYDSLVASF